MKKRCTMIGCNKILTWYIKDNGKKLEGVCPVHGVVTGVFRGKPLTIIGKNVLIVKGYRIGYQTLGDTET